MKNQWIEERLSYLAAQGLAKSKSGLASALGLPPSRVTEIIKGERKIQSREIAPMAHYLQMPELEIVAKTSSRGGKLNLRSFTQGLGVRVIGHIEAGAWRETLEWPEDQQFTVSAPPDPRYPGVPRIALEVRGNSMDEIFPPGTILICIATVANEIQPQHEQYVIVQRQNELGQTEMTCKQFIVQDGRRWLVPRSSDPAYQAPIDATAPDGDVTICGIVTFFIKRA